MSPKKRMPTGIRTFGMQFKINTKEAAHERPHVHVTKGYGKGASDLKVWLDTIAIASFTGSEMSDRDVTKALKLVRSMQDDFLSDYELLHGQPKSRSRR